MLNLICEIVIFWNVLCFPTYIELLSCPCLVDFHESMIWKPIFVVENLLLIMLIIVKSQEKKSIRPTFSAERIYGGTLLAICSNDFICFYDWGECRLIRRIDVNVKVRETYRAQPMNWFHGQQAAVSDNLCIFATELVLGRQWGSAFNC